MFADDLIERVTRLQAPCIVGLDPDLDKMPAGFGGATLASRADAAAELCAEVLEAVHDLVPAVKPQMAYFERFGSAGMAALERTIAHARRRGLLVILDGKRGDIGSTSAAYASAYLAREPARDFEVDALTVNPYLGMDSIEPFFEVCRRDAKGVFVLAKTSNPGSGDLQDRLVDGKPVYEHLAALLGPAVDGAIGARGYSSIGIVVGGTYPGPAQALRRLLPRSIFLVPGFGAQGADARDLRHSFNADGLGAVVNNSRAIMFPQHFGAPSWSREAIRKAAIDFVAQVRSALR